MRLVSILALLLIAAPAHGQEPTGTVIPDRLAMHERMSAASPVVAELGKDERVTVGFTMTGSGGTWCSVKQVGGAGKSGNVLCASLKRDPVDPPAAAPPPPPAPPFLPAAPAVLIPQAHLDAVCFVTLGGVRYLDLNSLAAYYQQKFGLQVRTLPAIALDAASFDPARGQYTAERLMDLLKRSLSAEVDNGRTLVIGITEGDMYIAMQDWTFAFGLRDSSGTAAVISSARMDENLLNGRPPDFDTVHRNVAKMISRDLGFMYYDLDVSPDPRSVLRPSILGLDDLEATGEEF